MKVGDFTLAGYTVAGEESIVIAPELDVAFDIGKCPREALNINHVLLTHGHMDHSAGLTYYFAQRDFQDMAPGTAVVPEGLVEPIRKLMSAWGAVEGHVPPYKLAGLRPGEEFEIRRGLFARAFPVRHAPGSLGYAVVDVRQKLKEEFIGLEGPQIVELKKRGVEITNRVEYPLVAYLGDTGRANYSSLRYVADARALLLECTFFDADHKERARQGKHIHVTDLAEVLEGMNNEKIVLIHVTRRTSMSAARQMLEKALPAATLERVSFLMGKRIEEE
jgi:ribonuclease Z